MSSSYWTSAPINSRNFEIAKMFNYISVGFLLADLIVSFPFDWSIITGKRHRRWSQLAYFGAKFTWITYMITNLIALWTIHKVDCQLLMNMTELQMGLVVCFSSSLLAIRTTCIYEGPARTATALILVVFGLGLLGSWMYGVSDVTSTWSSDAATLWNTGGCTYDLVKSTYWAKYVVTIAFDMLVLTLTTIRILRLNIKTRIGDVLIKHGLIYFILTCAANTVVTVLTLLQLSPVMSLFMAVPQSTVCVISSTRLYILLAEQTRHSGDTQANSDDFHETPFHASKFSSMIRLATGRNLGNIPSAFSKSVLSTDLAVSPNGSQHSSQRYVDTEKATDNTETMIRVDKSRTVQVDLLTTANLAIHRLTPVQEYDGSVDEALVALQYPRLLRRSKSPSAT